MSKDFLSLSGSAARSASEGGAGTAIRAVLFDFDGTLTRPEAIDFAVLRTLLGCPRGTAILEFIDALESEAVRREACRMLEEFELAAARASVPNDGAEELVGLLRDRGIGRGILTRNKMASIQESMKNFQTISTADFPVIITRENAGRPKPHPDGVHDAARLLGVPMAELLVVGDYVFDIAAGKAAGALTALLTNGRPEALMDPAPDFTIEKLGDLEALLGL
jgi:hydrogenase expression/formation protein HypE